MKKSTLLILLSVLVVAIAAVTIIVIYSNQGDEDNEQGDGSAFPAGQGPRLGLSQETETKLKQDFLNLYTKKGTPGATADDVWIRDYYGTYNGCVVVRMTDSFTFYYAAITYEVVDGELITYSDSNTALAWKNGKFYSLQDAYYDERILTKDDIVRIAGVWTMPWQEEGQIRQGYVDTFIKQNSPKATADGVWIEHYYGRYNNFPLGDTLVLTLWYGKRGAFMWTSSETVAGMKFFFYDGYEAVAWNGGNFYTLQEAYDKGFLSKEDIKEISGHHKATYPDLYKRMAGY